MEKLSNSSHVACEVALCPLGYTLAAPSYESILRKASVTILHFHKGELDATIAEVIYQIHKFTLYTKLALAIVMRIRTHLQCFGLSVRSLCSPSPGRHSQEGL